MERRTEKERIGGEEEREGQDWWRGAHINAFKKKRKVGKFIVRRDVRNKE